MSNLQTYTNNPLAVSTPIQYLTETQLNELTYVFQEWYDANTRKAQRVNRGRYWLTFLVLRFTGARIGEVLLIDDTTDIYFRNAEIRLVTLKRHNKSKKGKKNFTRIVPVPANVTSEIATYIAEYEG